MVTSKLFCLLRLPVAMAVSGPVEALVPSGFLGPSVERQARSGTDSPSAQGGSQRRPVPIDVRGLKCSQLGFFGIGGPNLAGLYVARIGMSVPDKHSLERPARRRFATSAGADVGSQDVRIEAST